MGVNLFVEGNPAPVVIRVRLPREVTNFKELNEVTSALKVVDDSLQKMWSEVWPNYSRRRHRDVQLLRFEVGSPPFFEVLADPAWLAVFFVILTGYKDARDSAQALASDVNWVYHGVEGLTDRQMQFLIIAVRLTLGRIAEKGAEESERIAKRFRRASDKLLGKGTKPPHIEVIDVENKKRPW